MREESEVGGRGWRRWMPLLLVGILPALLISLGSARFILNHFFARAPYLLDSGLLSGVVYRAGLSLAPPEIACNYATSFYQVYFSPIISALSALSYLVPVRRIEWFVFVQALIYLPFGFVVYSLSSQLDPASQLRRLPFTLLAALAFSFSGIVLWMIGYPHYEAATPALICLALGAVITGRTRLTWIAIALAVSVRQDGGLHVALALSPLLYLSWRGVDMLPSRRRLLVIIGVAIGASLAGFACQRLLWPPVDRLTPVYFGTPKYAHLTWSLVVERLENFRTDCELIYWPFLLTVGLAVWRRDARYLLGWAAVLPWFLFNFTAFDAAKSTFAAYTAGPFLVAMFWVYAYGAKLAPPARRLRPFVVEGAFALLCVASLLGSRHGRPDGLRAVARDMAFLQPIDRAAVHGFADLLLERPEALGRVYVDSPVAALVQEGFHLAEHWSFRTLARPDALAFYPESSEILREVSEAGLDHCIQAVGTRLYLCARVPVPAEILGTLAVRRMPAMFVLTRIVRPGVHTDEQGISLMAGFGLQGWLGVLPVGRYQWTIETDEAAYLQVGRPGEMTGLPAARGTQVFSFSSDGEGTTNVRVTALDRPVRIKSATLRRLDGGPAAR